jgi:fido (protein-threonine AMPylation protein)
MLKLSCSIKEIKLNKPNKNTTAKNTNQTLKSLAVYQTNASVSLEGFTLSPQLQADFELFINDELSLDQVIANTKKRHQQSQQTTTVSTSKTAPIDCEGDFTCVRILELKFNPVSDSFDAAHLKEINRHILQDMPMYNGGTLRLDSHEHVRSRSINQGEDSYVVHYKHGGVNEDVINQVIQKAGTLEELAQLSHEAFAERLAMLYGDLDHIHSFNEANSRTLRLFTEQLANTTSHSLDWSRAYMLSNPRGAIYMARDLEVSKRSFPHLSIETMRHATPSEFEAYDTQKKLKDIQTMHELMQYCLMLAKQDESTDTWIQGIMDGHKRMTLDEEYRKLIARRLS